MTYHPVLGALIFTSRDFHHDSSRCPIRVRAAGAGGRLAGNDRAGFAPATRFTSSAPSWSAWDCGSHSGPRSMTSQTWALLFGMAGYTLLLAVTACLLVRFVGVWDDVRTVLLLVVLMFLATSVTFDEVLARNSTRGIACYLGGLLFAVAVSEGMLRGIAWACRRSSAPYYLILALFFLYPVAIATAPGSAARSESLSWALFGFSPAAGLVFLTLLPAIRRGRDYVRDNGSPWGWAWYPWTLFGVLGFGVAGAVCLALLVDAPHPVGRDRAVHLRTLLPRAVRAGDRRDPARRSGWSSGEGACSALRCSCPRSWSC